MRCLALGAVLLCAACASTADKADLAPLWRQCASQTYSLVIDSCTKLINSGKLAKWEMALALNNRGAAHLQYKEYGPAIDDLNAALRVKPGYTLALVNRGTAYVDMNETDAAHVDMDELDKAITDLTAAIKARPRFTLAYIDRGSAYFLKGEYDKAIADYTKAIKQNPSFSTAYESRCQAYARKGQYKDALGDCTMALSVLPGVSLYLTKADKKSLSQPGLGDLLKRFAFLRQTHTAEILQYRGVVYFQMEDFSSAKADFRAALEAGGTSPELIYAQPWSDHYGVSHAPEDESGLLYLLALAETRSGETASADRDLARARKMDPNVAQRIEAGYGLHSP